MLPAIFAILLLGHFVAAEIYVGQNPQNVNAVIKDANGNLVPVTGVADEIVVVDLNYGGEGSSSGMSVDVSVSPVNSSSSSTSGYPSGEYPPMSSPSAPEELSNPSMSATPITFPSSAPVSLPSASSPSASAPSSNPLNPFSSMFGGSGSSGGSGSASSQSNPSGSSSNSNNALGTGSQSEIPPSSPVSEYDNMISNMNSGSSSTHAGASSPQHALKNPFSALGLPGLSGLFGSKPTEKKKSNSHSGGSLFIELGGALGPVNETQDNNSSSIVNNIPTVASVPLTSTMNSLGNFSPFNILGSLPKFNATFPPTSTWNSSIPVFNMSSIPMFNTSGFSTPSLPSFLNSLLGNSSMNLQPLSSTSSPFSSMINSFFNGSSSLFNPMNSNISPLTSLISPFLNTGSFSSSTSPFTNMMNSFMNTSSMFNPSNMMDSLNNMINSFVSNNPLMSNLTNESQNPFSDIMNTIMNITSLMMNSTNNSLPLTDLMDSALNDTTSMLDSNTKNGSSMGKFMNSMINALTPGDTNFTSIGDMLNPFLSLFTSGNNTGLKGMMQNMIPFNFGDDSDYDDYPEEDNPDLMSDLSGLDKDNYNLSQSLFPLLNLSPSSFPSTLSEMSDMIENLLTPENNGSTPLSNMVMSMFGSNGTLSTPANFFGPGGVLNLTTFAKDPSDIPDFFNKTNPLSNWLQIIQSLNSTGLFGDLSNLYTLTQNLSSIIGQSWNGKINKATTFSLAISYFQKIMKEVTSISQTFIKNLSSKLIPTNTAQSVPQYPQIQPQLMAGSSFLVIPSSPPAPAAAAIPAVPALTSSISTDGMMNDAPQPQSETTSETTPSQNVTTSEPSSINTPTLPQPSSTNQTNLSTGNPTPTPPPKAPGANNGINLSSTWITLVGCLIVAFGQKNFLGLI